MTEQSPPPGESGIEFTSEVHENYLQVTARGPYSGQSMRRMFDSVYRELESSGLRRMLLDLRGLSPTAVPSTAARYQQVVASVPTVTRLNIRAAAVTIPPFHDTFSETVANNRGISVRVFQQFDPALTWLLADVGENGEGR